MKNVCENYDVIKVLSKSRCSGCEACYNICPANAIEMCPDEEGFYYPIVNYEQCIKCGKCKKVCPVLHREVEDKKIKSYAAYNLNENIRRESTSGGIFTILAEYVLQDLQGVVVGVVFEEKFDAVKFIITENKKTITRMRGSKYIQARINYIYRDIKGILEKGKSVLFVGLPCQVEGLLNFLDKKYDNLICVDMVCYGVPSPGLWKKYIKETFGNDKISNIIFKDKKIGWKQWCFRVDLKEESKIENGRSNIYMSSFLNNINVRPSCFSCPFKGENRNSDFTIADCWGDGEKNEALNDNKGLSAIIVQSQKADIIWKRILHRLFFQEYDTNILMRGNWATYKAPEPNENREEFFLNMKKYSLEELVNKFCSG